MTSRRLLFAQLATRGAHPALRFDERDVSYAELYERARRCAGGLAAHGVVPGDRVCAYATTSEEITVALLACHVLGAVWVPINPQHRADEVRHILNDAGASLLLVAPTEDAAAVLTACPRPATLRHVVALDATGALPDEWRGAPFATLAAGTAREPVTLDDGAPALLIYTSGTTGRSKGVELSFGALVSAVSSLASAWRMGQDDVLVHALPLFHVHGLCVALHGALLTGMTTRMLPRFTPTAVVDAVRAGGTIFMGVPTMYARLLEHLAQRADDGAVLARARLFTAGSAPLPAVDLQTFAAATGHRILERYGMTETLISLTNPYDGARKANSVGRPVPGYDVEVRDDAFARCAPGEDGEVVVRGAGLLTRYWNNDAATEAAFRDGWFLTGDIGHTDNDGYFFLIGRKSTDVLKSGGYKIAAREIEEIIATLPWVREVAVVGVPDRVWGQKVVAVVVATDRAAATFEALTAHTAAQLADYKRPRALVLVDALPRNAMGKVQKNVLVATLVGGS